MIKERLSAIIEKALIKAKKAGQIFYEDIPRISFEKTRDKAFGDFATSVALSLAKQLKKNPLELAKTIIANIELDADFVEKVEIAGAGFLNFFLSNEYFYDLIFKSNAVKEKFFSCDVGKKKKIQVEFASVGPTGPAHIGHARGAVIGDVLANILKEVGYKVSKEYYINDFGNQIEVLGKTLKARYKELLDPSSITEEDRKIVENGYEGSYLIEIAEKLKNKYGNECLGKDISFFSAFAVEENLNGIKKDLEDFGVIFDSWTKETDLYKKKKVQKAIEHFKKTGHALSHDGALWFSVSDNNGESCEQDKDNVLVRQNGMPTYFASDIAYHAEKYKKNFDNIIDIWGQDHHGHVQRLKNAIEALGYDSGRIEVILYQLVSLTRGGEPIKMSTRKGDFVTLREVMDEVGRDSIRFFFLMRKSSSHFNFDLELAKSQSMENPVYYVQYAHARICSIFKEAEKKFKRKNFKASKEDLRLLKEDSEIEVFKKLAYFQDVLFEIANSREPQGLTAYLQELAMLFHKFYCEHKVISEDFNLTMARLSLIGSIRIVIAKGLKLLGIEPKERM